MNEPVEPVDVEAKVTRLETPDCPERDRAQALVEKVLAERQRWEEAWGAVLLDPAAARVHDYPPGTVGCGAGSCALRLGERVLARFLVRFDEATCDAIIAADWPRGAEWDGKRA